MEVRTIGKKIKHTMDAAAKEKLVREMRLADDKLCKGMFEFIDAQGGFLEFAYRKYHKEEISMYKFIHGEICEIPMGIVKHLNNTKKKVRRYNLEISQQPGHRTPRTFETISRVRFTPCDFL